MNGFSHDIKNSKDWGDIVLSKKKELPDSKYLLVLLYIDVKPHVRTFLFHPVKYEETQKTDYVAIGYIDKKLSEQRIESDQELIKYTATVTDEMLILHEKEIKENLAHKIFFP